jgi:hypothetical protein
MELKMSRTQKSISFILSIIAILFFIYLSMTYAILIWLLLYILGNRYEYFMASNANIENRNIFSIFFPIISIIGLITVLDNLALQNTAWSHYWSDDHRFYLNIVNLYNYGLFNNSYDSGPYEYLVYIVSRLFFPSSIPLLQELVLFNWFLLGLTALKVDFLVLLVTKKKIPIILLFSSLLLNFIIVDSSVRLYRDVLVIYLSLTSTIYIFKHKPIKAYLVIIPVFMLRGFSGILLAVMNILLVKYRRSSINNYYAFWSLVFIFLISSTLYSTNTFTSILPYLSQSKDIGLYKGVYSGMSLEEFVQNRHSVRVGRTGNEMVADAYSQNSSKTLSSIIRMATVLFFPITINSPYIYSSYIVGFSWYEVLKWVFVLNWIVLIPLIVTGVINIIQSGDGISKLIVLYFLVGWFLIALISTQQRHMFAFVIYFPLIIMQGTDALLQQKRLRSVYTLFLILTILLLAIWNILIK